jgi:hypothetical protein
LNFFLDTLWQAQDEVGLQKGSQQLQAFIHDVANPTRLLKLESGLLKAIGQTSEQQQQDVQVLKALLELGKAYAILEPVATPSEGDASLNFFLNTLWQSQDAAAIQKGTEELKDFFETTNSPSLPLFEFGTTLLKAIRLAPEELQEQKRDPKFLNALIQLGGVYTALDPNKSETTDEPLNFFLDTLWNAQDDQSLQKGAEELKAFFEGVKVPETALKHSTTILKSIKAVDDSSDIELQGIKKDPDLLKEAVEAGRTDRAYTYINTSYGRSSATGRHDPWAVIGVGKFIDYVEEVEAGYSQDTPEEVLTRIRNLYYSSSEFPYAFALLLPNAPDTEVVYGEPIERIVRREFISEEAFNRLNAQANENTAYGKEYGDNPSPYILRKGEGIDERIDVGHAFLTLDALLHPGSGRPFTVYEIPTIDPASWVADVALAVAWVDREQQGNPDPDAPPNLKLSNPPTALELDLYYDASAPVPDLLGDVDGFGLFHEWQSNPGHSLSELLQSYYEGTSPGVNNRWLTFCRLNRFVTVVGDEIIWQVENIKDELVQRVNNMAALVFDGNQGAALAFATGQRPSPYREFPYTEYMLNKFLAYVYQNLQRELGI